MAETGRSQSFSAHTGFIMIVGAPEASAAMKHLPERTCPSEGRFADQAIVSQQMVRRKASMAPPVPRTVRDRNAALASEQRLERWVFAWLAIHTHMD